jgi:septal ring factor EnvC (AmiA/AmiB activator)
VEKTTVIAFIAFIVGLALGILGTAGAVLAGQSGDPGGLAGLDRAVQQETERTVANLERTIGEQRKRIDDLQASNSRLEERITDARGIVEQLTVSTGSAAQDIRSAITLFQTIKDQVNRLDGVLGSGPPGGSGGDGVDNVQDL